MAYRIRRRRSGVSGGFVASALAAGIGLAVLSGHHAAAASAGAPGSAAAEAIAYAQAQIGKPYEWGGTGPGAFDCSGLVTQAYAVAGVSIARTSQEQWATEPHVTSPRPGDLVFFTGTLQPGEQPPGHVGLVFDPARHLMIDAYDVAAGVRYDTYGLASSAPGLSVPWGFSDPGGA